VTAYARHSPRSEIGTAFGATPGSIVRLVLRRVSLLMAAGVVIGTGLGAWSVQFADALLFGLEPPDPMTLVGAAVTLAAEGAAAGWLPAHRAARIDPAAVLRDS
jgi:putative ABC transport system permease protein